MSDGNKQLASDVLSDTSRCPKPATRGGGRSAKFILESMCRKGSCPGLHPRRDETGAKPLRKPRSIGRSLARGHRGHAQLCKRGRLETSGKLPDVHASRGEPVRLTQLPLLLFHEPDRSPNPARVISFYDFLFPNIDVRAAPLSGQFLFEHCVYVQNRRHGRPLPPCGFR
jgi:hypothetical protein